MRYFLRFFLKMLGDGVDLRELGREFQYLGPMLAIAFTRHVLCAFGLNKF
jgi:hypothetical protein